MKFKLIKKVVGEVNCYGKMVKTGGTVEFTGVLAEKAGNNPDFVEVIAKPKPKPKAKAVK